MPTHAHVIVFGAGSNGWRFLLAGYWFLDPPGETEVVLMGGNGKWGVGWKNGRSGGKWDNGRAVWRPATAKAVFVNWVLATGSSGRNGGGVVGGGVVTGVAGVARSGDRPQRG